MEDPKNYRLLRILIHVRKVVEKLVDANLAERVETDRMKF